MKKNLVIVLLWVFVLGSTGTVFAVANPFVDVPAKHWAYDSVAKLVKAGIVDGYGDGTFRGDKTLTRYEMAVIVAKAMANQEKADAAQKADIAKLEAEFSDELAKLGVRVAALENRVGNITFSGQLRQRYEWTKVSAGNEDHNPLLRTRLRLNMTAQLTDDLQFHGRYTSESNGDSTYDNSAATKLEQAYLSGKLMNGVNISLGRMPLTLGKGLTVDTSHNWDGAILSFGNSVKVNLGAAKYDINYQFGDIAYAFSPNFDMTAAYFKDKNSAWYDTWAVGLGYKAGNFAFTGEYGKNSSDLAKHDNNGADAKAWYTKVQYLGADGAKVKSYGFWVTYRRADKSFDTDWWDTFDYTIKENGWANLDNTKGLEYGFEYTVFKNGILSLQYNDMKDLNGNELNRRAFIANLTYSF